MSDPKWKRFLNPVMGTAVSALSGLISAELLDKLLEREFLSDEKYEKILQSLDDSQIISKEIARKLFLTLKCLPPPSFDNFCAVIEQVYGKNLLFCCLNPSLQESKDVDSASQSCEQFSDTSSGENVLNIFADEKLMEEYQPHHECVVPTTEMKTKSLQVSLIARFANSSSVEPTTPSEHDSDMSVSSPNTLHRQALGREFPLGSLYNARRDVFVPGSLYRSIPAEALSSETVNTCHVRHSTGDSFKSRCDLLNIKDNFRVNLLAFDVGIPEGFFPTRDESHKTASAVLSVHLETTEEALAIDNEDLKKLIIDEALDDEQATHVVFGIQWGANALVKFRTAADSIEIAKSSSAQLESEITATAAKLSNSLNKSSSMEEIGNDFFANFKFDFYGDVVPADDEPVNIEEVMEYLNKVPGVSQRKNSGKGYPVSYKLYPISLLRDKQSLDGSELVAFQSVDIEAAGRISELYSKICDEEKAFSDLIDDAKTVIDFVTKDVTKTIISLRKETKQDASFVFDLKNEMTKERFGGARTTLAAKLSKKWLAMPKRSIPGIEELKNIVAFLREKQIRLLPRDESLEETLAKDQFRSVHVLFTRLNPLGITVDMLQKKHENYWKLCEDEKDTKSVFLVVDVGIHSLHQSEEDKIKLFHQGKKGAAVAPRKTLTSMPPEESFEILTSPGSHESQSQPVSTLCQECKFHGEEQPAAFVCISNCKFTHYCIDCWEHVHKRPKMRSHKYNKVPEAPKGVSKESRLNLKKEDLSLPISSFPWKVLEPGLFQLLKVVFDETVCGIVEKIVFVEEEISVLCNAYASKSSNADCTKIDFESLKAYSVTPTGLVGENRAIFNFLQTNLHLNASIDYEKMTDSKFCPTGLYALLPNKSALFLFYWRSGNDSKEFENISITCQMLRHIRDLCSELFLCFDDETFSNIKFPRPENKQHLAYEDLKIENDATKLEARASTGFTFDFEPTQEKVVLSAENGNFLYICKPRVVSCSIDSGLFTTSSKDLPERLQQRFDGFTNYKILWIDEKTLAPRGQLSQPWADKSIRDILKLTFPNFNEELEKIDKMQSATEDSSESEYNKFASCWKENVSDFLKKHFPEEDERCCFVEIRQTASSGSLDEAERMVLAETDIMKDFTELRKKTWILQNSSLKPNDVDEFYNFSKPAKKALEQIERENVSFLSKVKAFAKSKWHVWRHTGILDRSITFSMPEDEELNKRHLYFFQNLREHWANEKVPCYEQYKRFKYDAMRRNIIRRTDSGIEDSGIEFGNGSFTFTITSFHWNDKEATLLYKQETPDDKVEYKVCTLEVNIERATSPPTFGSEQMYSFRPVIRDLADTEMSVPKGDIEVRALYSIPKQDKMLLLVYEKLNDSKDGHMAVYLENWKNLTHKATIHIGHSDIRLTAFDAETRLLALFDKEKKIVAIYELTKIHSNLKGIAEISLKDEGFEEEVFYIQFLKGEQKILLVDSHFKGHIYHLKLKAFASGKLNFKTNGEELTDILTYYDFVLTVSKEESQEKQDVSASQCKFIVRAYSALTYDLVGTDKLHTFVNAHEKSQFRLLQLSYQLHFVCIDVITGKCQSTVLDLISPGRRLAFASSARCTDLKSNEILENFYAIFRKYPIVTCYSNETKPLKITFVIPDNLRASTSRDSVQEHMQSYFPFYV